MAKLHDFYKDSVVAELAKQFNYNSVMQVPRIEKITLNMGLGEAVADKKVLENALDVIKRFTVGYIHAWELERWKYPEELRERFRKLWVPEFGFRRMSPFLNITVKDSRGGVLFEQGHVDYRGTGVGIGTDLPEDTLAILQDACFADVFNAGINAYYRIATRHFTYHEYEAYIVLIVAVLEKEIFISCRKHLAGKGKSESEIDSELVKTQLRADGITPQTISYRAALKKMFDGNVWRDSPQWRRCEMSLYRLRDEIIHGDALLVTRDEAMEASGAFNEFIGYINREVFGGS